MLAIQRNLDLFNGIDHHVAEELNINVSKADKQCDNSLDGHGSSVKVEGEFAQGKDERKAVLEDEHMARSLVELEQEYCMECFFTKYSLKPLANHAKMMKNGKVCKGFCSVVKPSLSIHLLVHLYISVQVE